MLKFRTEIKRNHSDQIAGVEVFDVAGEKLFEIVPADFRLTDKHLALIENAPKMLKILKSIADNAYDTIDEEGDGIMAIQDNGTLDDINSLLEEMDEQ